MTIAPIQTNCASDARVLTNHTQGFVARMCIVHVGGRAVHARVHVQSTNNYYLVHAGPVVCYMYIQVLRQ